MSEDERIENAKSKINEDFVNKGAEKITTDDVERVISKSEKIIEMVRKIPVLGRYLEDIIVMLQMLIDYIKGEYKEVPWWVIASVTFALVYLLSPIDVIPDFIPVIGYIDDAFV
ncbi:MAG: YkvA family protein, partial [Candidatus Tenebribacter davisii]|nr:YkvA family protein [Candidatus Tenebribacter davisii]